MKLLDKLLGRERRKAASTPPPIDIDAMSERYGSLAALELGNALQLSAARCAKAVDSHIAATDKDERHQQRFRIICEFFYFFLHLTNRRFYADHGPEVGERWQGELGSLIVEDFLDGLLDSFFSLPAEKDDRRRDLRNRMLAENYQKINTAEADYSACRGLLEERPFGNGLFNKLGRNVAALAGRGENPATIHCATMEACDVFVQMKLESLVTEVAAELRSRRAA